MVSRMVSLFTYLLYYVHSFYMNYGYYLASFCHVVAEGEVLPNKLPRPASSSHVQNGKTLGFDHIHTTYPSSSRHGNQNNIKAERLLKHKEHAINGTVVTQASPVDLKPLPKPDLAPHPPPAFPPRRLSGDRTKVRGKATISR